MKTREDRIRNFAKWALILLILFSTFLLSPYLKYNNAEAARKRAQAALDDKSPQLNGFINQFLIVNEPGTTNSSLLFVEPTIVNSGGSPSIAENFELEIVFTNKTSFDADSIDFSDEFKTNIFSRGNEYLVNLKRPQLLSEKTIKAVGMGEGSIGWLAFRLSHNLVNDYNFTNYQTVLSYLDKDGRRLFVTNGFWNGKPARKIIYSEVPLNLPGSENIFTKVIVPAGTNTAWLPPELPPGCSNVVIFLGANGIIYSRPIAEISPENSGTKFAVKDLPDFLITNMDKMPNYSPHMENMWIRWNSAKQGYGDKTVDLPILPLVVSNRFYVDVQIPFLNEKRKLVMSREFDPALSKLPKNWDWNYSTNYNSFSGLYYYEIVNEFTNPVLQVFYAAPNEIHVFGIFIVDTNQILETFGGPPQLLTLATKFINMTNMQEITNAFEISEALGTNSMGNIMTNYMYDLKFPESKTIFKYPFNRNPNVFADWIMATNKSDTKTLDKMQ